MTFCFGGGEGIRTLVGLHPNGFQDRLVMTTSIPLRIGKNYLIVNYVGTPNRSNGFQDFVPFRKRARLVHETSFAPRLTFSLSTHQKRHTVSFLTRLPVMTTSIPLRIGKNYLIVKHLCALLSLLDSLYILL